MKKYFVIMFLLTISSCGGGGDSPSTPNTTLPTTPTISDSRLLLQPPVEQKLIYTGPTAVQSVGFQFGYRENVGENMVDDESVWTRCGSSMDAYIADNGVSCALLNTRVGAPFDSLSPYLNFGNEWSPLPDNINTSSQYEIIEEQPGAPGIYGKFSLGLSLLDLPSTSFSSQASAIYTIHSNWINYPSYLTVQSETESLDAHICTHIFIVAVEIDSGTNPISDTIVVTDENICGKGYYEFSPPPESELWTLNEPISYGMSIEQVVTKSNYVQ